MMEILNIIGLIVGVLGGLAGLVSSYISIREWRKVNRKVAMLEDAGTAFEVVPTWYTSRMMQDHWLFALHMSSGHLVAINRIKAVSSDGNWMDVELATDDEIEHVDEKYRPIVVAVSDDRRSASVKISEIQAAFDLQTS